MKLVMMMAIALLAITGCETKGGTAAQTNRDSGSALDSGSNPIPTSGTLIINVSPVTGKYEVRNDVAGTAVVNEHSGNFNVAGIPFGDYVVKFKDIGGGYTTPADIHFTLDATHLSFTANGTYAITSASGALTVNVTPASGKYEVRNDVTGTVVVTEHSGNFNVAGIPFGDYVVKFKDIGGGYATPADIPFTLDATHLSFTANGTYAITSASGALTVNVTPA
ncbi:hypothetical protein HZA44_01285, partial [Candidatus Peregrinibacteria bacterium]|nr:hypothetical protein [Candidatus Peregrinibacteria bacterium]